MFYHGWNAYKDNAFPSDELRPLTCDGLDRDLLDPLNLGRNDVLGNYSLTLVDSLDMFAILGDQQLFKEYVQTAEHYVSFNVSSTVQVFETTIRGMGGLLSAHLYASVPRLGSAIDGYNGHLLSLAYDLGVRLLPAFETPTGIPSPRINLRSGVNDSLADITETCSSGAGSLLLEFGLLSRLTGDGRFEHVARKAFFALYIRRSDLDLVAMSIDSQTGQWRAPLTGNGASIDSFYEYALKYSILFGDNDFMAVFNRLYHALKAHSFNGWTFRNIHYDRAYLMTSWVDSLASFFTSLMVLVGDLEGAIRNHLTYFKIWSTYAGLPERWTFIPKGTTSLSEIPDVVTLEWYPLRPEFIESNYYLYQATKDPIFLQIGWSVMKDLQQHNRVPCGYAGIQDVRTGELANRMESFFLSETVKYLYLLFNRTHELNNEFSNFVFSTEAHPFWYDDDILEHASYTRFPMLEFSGENEVENSDFELPPQVSNFTIFSQVLEYIGIFLSNLIRALDDILLPSHMVQYMEEVHETSTFTNSSESSHSRAGPLNMPRFLYDEQCEVIRPSWQSQLSAGMFSKVGSWDLFYQLDSLYVFSQPSYLPVNRSQEFTSFYDRYIDPRATCRAPSAPSKTQEDGSMDLLISIPEGGRRGTVIWRHGGGEVETTSLLGMRLKLRKTDDDYQITMINGIKVPSILWVREMITLNKNNDLSLEVVEGQVYLSGIPVRNVKVIGK